MLQVIHVTSAPHLLCVGLFLVSTGLFLFAVARRSFPNASGAVPAMTGNAILVLTAVSLLVALIDPFILSFRAMDAFASSGTRDVFIISIGFLEFIAETLFYLILTAAMVLEYAIVKAVLARKR